MSLRTSPNIGRILTGSRKVFTCKTKDSVKEEHRKADFIVGCFLVDF